MKILALETSGYSGELALLEDGAVVAELLLDPQQRTAQSLAPGMSQILADAGWQPREIGLVAVTIGPGSFTGLRVGVTAAKTFCYAVGAECLGVDTLAVIAEQVAIAKATLWAVLDAQRSQLFAARFEAEADRWRLVEPAAVVDSDAWLARLAPGTLVTGSGLKRLKDCLPEGVAAVAESLWTPQAATVGRVAWREYEAGRRDDFWKLTPHYLRPSAAEEKRAAQERPGS